MQFNVLTNHNFFDHARGNFWPGPAPCHAPHSRTKPSVEQHTGSQPSSSPSAVESFSFYSSQPLFRSTSSSSSYSSTWLETLSSLFIVNRLLRSSQPGRSHLPTHREDSGVVTSKSRHLDSSSLIIVPVYTDTS